MAPRSPFTVFGNIFPTSGGAGPGTAAPDATGKVYTVSGLKPGTSAILYANGTQVATATANAVGRVTWTLANRPATGAVMTYDGTVTGPAGIVPNLGTTPITLTISGTPIAATVGSAYSFTPTVTGGSGTRTFSLSGTLPGGLSFATSTGAITGTPTTAGTASGLAITVTDSGVSVTLSGLSIVVSAPSVGDPNRRMFAATRLRFPTVTGTFPSNGTYQVQEFAFGTPDYPVTEPQFFLPNFYQLTTGAATSEIAGPNVINFEGLSIKVGDTWYACPTAAFTMDPSVEASGYLLDAITGVTLPANTVLRGRIAFNGASGATMWGATRANDIGEVSVGSTSSLAAALTDGRTLTQANSVSRQFVPSYMVARGWDGRPVFALAGDSIQAGANENSITGFLSARGVQGFWQRGLDDNTSSQRIAFGTLALEGSRPSDWQNRTAWARKLDAVKKAAALNANGAPPFTAWGSNHGNNSVTVSDLYGALVGFWNICKAEYPNIPIYHSEMLARPSSSDGYQSLANQTTATADTYPNGNRWTVNEKIGKGSLTGDATAQARTDGYIAGSFAAWRPGSYDTGSNRDKLSIVPFDTTLTADSGAGNLTVQLASVSGIVLGDMLIGNPGGTGAYDAVVKAINGNAVTLSGGSGSTLANGTRFTAALNDRTGLHPGTRHFQKIAAEAVIPWKQAMGWGLGPSTNLAAEPVGTLTRSGTQVYQLAAGASISGTNASHFAVNGSGAVTVSAAGQTAALNGGPYSLTITGDSSVTTLQIPTEAGTIDVYDTVDASTLLAAVNYAYSSAPNGTDWIVRPRRGSTSTATTTAGILIKDKAFGGTLTDVNLGIIDETKIQRSAKASFSNGSLTIQPRTPLTAKMVGFASATAGECLVLQACNNIAVLDMAIENVAGTDGSDISVPDRTDDNYPAQEATFCIKIRMDGAPSWLGNHIFRGNRIGASESSPYTRYPTAIKILSGGNVAFEDNLIKNTLIGLYMQTALQVSSRRNYYVNYLLDAVDLFNDNYNGSNPAYPATESLFASSDDVIGRPNMEPQFAGAHCDGLQGSPGSIRSMRLSVHFNVYAMAADENVKQTQGGILKDLQAGVFIRGRMTNCVINESTLNGLVLAGMDPDDRLVLDKLTIFRATEADPVSGNAGPPRITVEKNSGDATRHGPMISRTIYGAFYDTTGSTKSFTADPVPGGSGSRTLTGGGTVLFNNNFYLDQRTQNGNAGNSAQEVFTGMANAAYVANRGYQYAYDYTSYGSIRSSAQTIFAVNPNGPAAAQGASLADIYNPGSGTASRLTMESGTGSLLSESGGGFVLKEVA